MQNTAGQKSGDKFTLVDSPERVKPRTSFFEIIPESEEARKNAHREFQIAPIPARPNAEKGDEPVIKNTTSTQTAAGNRVAELLVNAETLITHGEKSLARVLVYEALKLDSKNTNALKKAIQFVNPKTNPEQLIRLQKQICEADFSFESVSQLGHYHYLNSEDEQAFAAYNKALGLLIDETDSLFEIYKNIGNIMTRAGDFDGAEEYFHKAYTICPDSDVLLVNLGTLSVQRQDFAAALERFRKAVEKNMRNDKAWVGLALSHQQMGDFQLSNANIERALDLNPLNRTAVHIYANWCIRDGKYLTAIQFVENYLASVELDEELSLVLIHLFCKTNQFALAQLEAERVLLWNPENEQMSKIEAEIKDMKETRLEKAAS